jgi:ribose transport system substrate-binding protein
MVGLYGYNGPACLKVLDELNKLDDIMIVAFDEHEETLEGVAKGQIRATVVQNTFQYGYESVRLLKTWSSGKEHLEPLRGTGYMYLPCEIVTKDNVAEHRANLTKRLSGRKTSENSNQQ